MTMTLDQLRSLFEGEREDRERQHALVAHYLLQTLEERHEGLILAAIANEPPEELVTIDYLGQSLLVEYVFLRTSRPPRWIDQALEKLKDLGLIVYKVPHDDPLLRGGYALSESASFMREWLSDGLWKEDEILGLEEWWHPTKLLVSP